MLGVKKPIDDSPYLIGKRPVSFQRCWIAETEAYREGQLRLHLEGRAPSLSQELPPFASREPAVTFSDI